MYYKQVLDNCDGKQARRTANSTSLGLLFDHGLDSIALPVIAMSTLHLIGLKEVTFMLYLMSSSTSFYHGTYEQ